jgi:hypothetical protein
MSRGRKERTPAQAREKAKIVIALPVVESVDLSTLDEF